MGQGHAALRAYRLGPQALRCGRCVALQGDGHGHFRSRSRGGVAEAGGGAGRGPSNSPAEEDKAAAGGCESQKPCLGSTICSSAEEVYERVQEGFSGHAGALLRPLRSAPAGREPLLDPYRHVNDGKDLQVRITYSNVPLLQHMQVYLPEDEPAAELHPVEDIEEKTRSGDPRRKSPYGMIRIGADGGMLMPYEILINPDAVVSKPLHFPWKEVKRELDKLEALGKSYAGRRLYMMYNPVTGRTNGITPNFFATMTIRPPKIVDRPHRHVSAAINYYFHGKGYSTVAGNRYEWAAGDLMLSAPGWAVHNHASYDDYVYELTVQDQPLNIFMESLLWQQSLKKPAALLRSEPGFETNRGKAAAA